MSESRRFAFLVNRDGEESARRFMLENVIQTYRKVVLLGRTHGMYRRQLIRAYCEAKAILGGNDMSKKTPYWWDAINKARLNGGFFTPIEKSLAGSWIDCACGKQDPRIPRKPPDPLDPQNPRGGEPLDHLLSNLGFHFSNAVNSDSPEVAARVLSEIECRSAEILEEMKRAEQI